MILISCALMSEAIYIIEKYKLQPKEKSPKIYTNDMIVLVITGIGKTKVINSLEYIYAHYPIAKAINIGIAGIGIKEIPIGELFCTTHKFENIKYMRLKTVQKVKNSDIKENCLYDMEGEFFYSLSQKHISKNNIYIYKIVSDHLDLGNNIPNKEFVKQLVKNGVDKLDFLD